MIALSLYNTDYYECFKLYIYEFLPISHFFFFPTWKEARPLINLLKNYLSQDACCLIILLIRHLILTFIIIPHRHPLRSFTYSYPNNDHTTMSINLQRSYSPKISSHHNSSRRDNQKAFFLRGLSQMQLFFPSLHKLR